MTATVCHAVQSCPTILTGAKPGELLRATVNGTGSDIMKEDTLFAEVCEHARGIAVLGSVEAVLGWDEQTMLPKRAAEHRGVQAAALASLLHHRWLDPGFGESLATLRESMQGNSHDPAVRCTIAKLWEDRERRLRMPPRLVEELASVGVAAQQAWVEARRCGDWSQLQPWLEKMFALKREQAACRAPELEPYDALLDEYEPGGRSAEIAERFARLREGIVPLVREVAAATTRPDMSVLEGSYPQAAQELFVRHVAEQIGFDFERGRLDTAAHPFCSSLGPSDCRITTRWDEKALVTSLYGVLHEAGHGLYEQGLPADWFGLPPGEAASLGIHESQSRLWENLVGRSSEFWQWCFPLAQKFFPTVFADVRTEQVHQAMLEVKPSMIRVEADEVTYNLHVMMRFDLERAVVSGDLTLAELPAAWTERFEHDFGLVPASDAEGVLQDIHWSAGLVGYFPTYTLGNIYAAELMAAAEHDLPNLRAGFAAGQFAELLHWLSERVHKHGRQQTSDALVEQAIGRPPAETALLESLRRRYGPAYGLS